MRGNQLLDSVTRWHHGSQICFASFILVKNHEIANNSATTEAGEKNKRRFGISGILEFFMCLTKFENYQILLNKIKCRFLVTTKLFTG
jgi:hypothetical protein